VIKYSYRHVKGIIELLKFRIFDRNIRKMMLRCVSFDFFNSKLVAKKLVGNKKK
jgi:hypothetical protein